MTAPPPPALPLGLGPAGSDGRRVLWASALLAVLVEAGLLAGAGLLWLHPLAVPPPAPPIRLDLTAAPQDEPAPSPPAPIPAPAPPAVAETPPPPRAAPPVPRPAGHPQPRRPAAPPPAAAAATVPAAPAAPAAEAAAPAEAAPAPTPPPAAGEVPESFQASVRQTVQAALRYPNAARIRHLTGRAKLRFAYRDGRASDSRIAESSGFDVLDRAALDALAEAALPAPPADLAGHTLTMVITVVFSYRS